MGCLPAHTSRPPSVSNKNADTATGDPDFDAILRARQQQRRQKTADDTLSVIAHRVNTRVKTLGWYILFTFVALSTLYIAFTGIFEIRTKLVKTYAPTIFTVLSVIIFLYFTARVFIYSCCCCRRNQ